MKCEHRSARYVRVPMRNGSFHIMERCEVCGGNVRGPGVWVRRDQCPEDPDTLPVLEAAKTAEDRGEQPLFDFGGES
jgi:hypothetical protein